MKANKRYCKGCAFVVYVWSNLFFCSKLIIFVNDKFEIEIEVPDDCPYKLEMLLEDENE